jgi:WD40 repeat protein
MPLPLLKLDDRLFTDLVDELRAAIPHHTPTWTNYNLSDPGIMFMELFAWLTENTIYRINRVTPASRARFLELLGGVFQAAQPALIELTVTAKGLHQSWSIKRGTRIDAHTDPYGTTIPFETLTPITLTPITPVGTLTARQSVLVDEEELGWSNGKPYQRFALKQSAIVLPGEPFPRTPKVYVNKEQWEYRRNLHDSGATDRHFTIKPWLNAIIFGDGQKGMRAPDGATITAIYRTNVQNPRVVQDSWRIPFSARAAQIFRLQHPLLLLDLQEPDDFEPVLSIGNERWRYQSNFLELERDANQFTVEPWANAIRFGGTAEHGKLPGDVYPIQLTYRHTAGAQGNLPRGTTFTIKVENGAGAPEELVVDPQFKTVQSGVDRTDLAEVRDQVFAILKPRWRAITNGDFQEVITAGQKDVINVTPVPAQELTSSHPATYRPSHVSVLLTPGALYELSKPSTMLQDNQLISLDGRRLLIYPTIAEEIGKREAAEQQAQLWDIVQQRRLEHFAVTRLRKAEFSPDHQHLVTNDGDEVARLWQAEDGEPIAFLQPTLYRIAWRIDEQTGQVSLVATDNGGAVVSWAVESSSVQTTIVHGSYDKRFALSANGERLATVSNNKVVTIWDTQQKTALITYVHEAEITMLAFSADGKKLAVAGNSSRLYVYKVTTVGLELERQRKVSSSITALAMDATGVCLAFATVASQITLWSIEDNQISPPFTHSAPANFLLIDRANQRLIAADGDGNATIWDTDSQTYVANFTHSKIVYAAAIDPGQRYFVTASADQCVRVWDLRQAAGSTSQPTPLLHDGAVYSLAFNATGEQLATAGAEGVIRIWPMQGTTIPQRAEQRLVNPIDAYCFSPTQSWLVTIARDRKAWLWDRKDGMLITALTGSAQVEDARFSPEGDWLATRHVDDTVRLWDAAAGQLCVCYRHAAAITKMWFSPTATFLATLDGAGIVRLWPVQPGDRQLAEPSVKDQPFATLAQTEPIRELTWSADSSRVVTWGQSALLWSSRTGKLLDTLVDGLANATIVQICIDPTVQLIAAGLQLSSGSASANLLRLWSARAGELLAERSLAVAPLALSFRSNGQRLLMLGADHSPWIWTLRLRKAPPTRLDVEALLAGAPADDGWMHRAGDWLATRQENLILLWDCDSGRLLSTFYHEHGDSPVESSTPTQTDSGLIVTKFSRAPNTTLRVWNAAQVATVRALLDERKLIATHHHVAGVAYTNVWISATVVRYGTAVHPNTIQKKIAETLRTFFHPHLGGPQQQGWPMGRAIYASEIFQLIEGIDGVDHVELLTIDTKPLGASSGQKVSQTAIRRSRAAQPGADHELTQLLLAAHHLVNCHVQPEYFTIVDAEILAGRGRRKELEKGSTQ